MAGTYSFVGEDAGPPETAGRLLVVSHACTTVFAVAWEFALPLALLAAYSRHGEETLFAPAALTLAQTATTMGLAPAVGRRVDATERRRAMVCARAVQVSGTTASLVGVLLLNSSTRHRFSLLVLVLAGSCLETLGSLVTKSAPKKDWAPTIFEGDAYVEEQSRVTVRLSNVSQIAEVLGPFFGAVALAVAPRTGPVAVGAAAVLAELPAQLLLDALYAKSPELRRPRTLSEDDDASFLSLRSAWLASLSQPSGAALLTASFAMLFFTALAPHGAVLTAYLATRDVHPYAISLFRALGAAAGMTGISLFSTMTKTTPEKPKLFKPEIPGAAIASRVVAIREVAGVALALQASAAVVAAACLHIPHALVVFMAAVVLSRAGLYAYDVGYLELQQLLVDERDRAACSGVESALCGAAELGVAVYTLTACSDPRKFGSLANASATFVIASLLTFTFWAYFFHVHEHVHEHESQNHFHTAQQSRTLQEAGGDRTHVHVHYGGPRVSVQYHTHATPTAHTAMSPAHSHTHDHDAPL
ncbi:hypothetical protein CTAYLR_001311 [Chrysophaeum taylorii]|uniref:Solute carrier family 40 member n=1 Tax=Chrysophaeum taylorii TaxID=2483200 RepID=A0AAD7UF05_9STRA|nr:hypothetical protein CTAYLR_001311 [Chrysophaeum taylorii]